MIISAKSLRTLLIDEFTNLIKKKNRIILNKAFGDSAFALFSQLFNEDVAKFDWPATLSKDMDFMFVLWQSYLDKCHNLQSVNFTRCLSYEVEPSDRELPHFVDALVFKLHPHLHTVKLYNGLVKCSNTQLCIMAHNMPNLR